MFGSSIELQLKPDLKLSAWLASLVCKESEIEMHVEQLLCMLLVEQSLVAGRTINLVEHSIQPMTKPNSNTHTLPAPLIAGGKSMKFSYVSETGAHSTCELTASAQLRASSGLDDLEFAPEKVDVLLIPGPDPSIVLTEEVVEFVRVHYEREGMVIMTLCTGVYVAGFLEILVGKGATAPRG